MVAHEIQIEDATEEWLLGYLARFRVARSTIGTEREARLHYLSAALGISVDHVTVQTGFVSFTANDLGREDLLKLLATTITYEGRRLTFHEIGAELYSIPYQEGESATVRIEFREPR